MPVCTHVMDTPELATDPIQRWHQIGDVMDDVRAGMAWAAQVRRQAVAQLVSDGRPVAEVARLLGVSEGRVRVLMSEASEGGT